MNLLIIVFLFLLLYKISFTNEYYDDYLGKENSNILRGIFAIIVVIHHLAIQTNDGALLFHPFIRFGYLAVSVFFFISGYGLIYQYRTKTNYLNGFIVKRIPKVLIPYILMTMLYIVSKVILKKGISIKMILTMLRHGQLIINNSWYIVAIIIFYIFFYAAFRLSKEKYNQGNLMVFLLVTGYIGVCKFLGFESWWYNTSYSFVIGIVWCINEERIKNYIKKTYYLSTVLIVALFIISFAILYHNSNIPSNWWVQTSLLVISSSLFVLLVINLAMKIKINCGIWTLLGNISFEIYMIHELIYKALGSGRINIHSDWIYVSLSLILSILSAYIAHKIFIYIFSFRFKSSTKQNYNIKK